MEVSRAIEGAFRGAPFIARARTSASSLSSWGRVGARRA